MQLADITPMILTFNEEANLRRTLEAIAWAKQILIVDSFSTDATLSIVAEFPQTKVVQRPFDHFADQCNFGLQQIETNWVLSLDADYVCPPSLPEELSKLDSSACGFRVAFLYGIYGKPLRSCLYPPRTVLYLREKAKYERDGHAHRVSIDGEIENLQSRILHDDHKPLDSWLRSQFKYAKQEAEKLSTISGESLGWKDRLRKKIICAPFLTLIYCLMYKRLLLDGWRGVFYSLQRTFAELTLSLALLDRQLRN